MIRSRIGIDMARAGVEAAVPSYQSIAAHIVSWVGRSAVWVAADFLGSFPQAQRADRWHPALFG